jgi:hypothetical protein
MAGGSDVGAKISAQLKASVAKLPALYNASGIFEYRGGKFVKEPREEREGER